MSAVDTEEVGNVDGDMTGCRGGDGGFLTPPLLDLFLLPHHADEELLIEGSNQNNNHSNIHSSNNDKIVCRTTSNNKTISMINHDCYVGEKAGISKCTSVTTMTTGSTTDPPTASSSPVMGKRVADFFSISTPLASLEPVDPSSSSSSPPASSSSSSSSSTTTTLPSSFSSSHSGWGFARSRSTRSPKVSASATFPLPSTCSPPLPFCRPANRTTTALMTTLYPSSLSTTSTTTTTRIPVRRRSLAGHVLDGISALRKAGSFATLRRQHREEVGNGCIQKMEPGKICTVCGNAGVVEQIRSSSTTPSSSSHTPLPPRHPPPPTNLEGGNPSDEASFCDLLEEYNRQLRRLSDENADLRVRLVDYACKGTTSLPGHYVDLLRELSVTDTVQFPHAPTQSEIQQVRRDLPWLPALASACLRALNERSGGEGKEKKEQDGVTSRGSVASTKEGGKNGFESEVTAPTDGNQRHERVETAEGIETAEPKAADTPRNVQNLDRRQDGKRCQRCRKNADNEADCIYHPGNIRFYSCKQCGGLKYYTCCGVCDGCKLGCRSSTHHLVEGEKFQREAII